MDRRNFLAFIPTLSAIPFIGTDLIKTESGILLQNPEIQPKATISSVRSIFDIEVRLYNQGQHIANAQITHFNIDAPYIETTCKDNLGDASYINPYREMTLQATVINPEKIFS